MGPLRGKPRLIAGEKTWPRPLGSSGTIHAAQAHGMNRQAGCRLCLKTRLMPTGLDPTFMHVPSVLPGE